MGTCKKDDIRGEHNGIFMSVSLEGSLTYGCPSSCSKPPCFLDVNPVNYVLSAMNYSYSIYSVPTPRNTKESGKLANSILPLSAAVLEFQSESGWVLVRFSQHLCT